MYADAQSRTMLPTIPETMDMMREPSTAHQNPCTSTPTPNRLIANHEASRMNSQLMTRYSSPNVRIENGNASAASPA